MGRVLLALCIGALSAFSYAGDDDERDDQKPVYLSFAVTPAQVRVGESAVLSWAASSHARCRAKRDWSGLSNEVVLTAQ